jgi:hypothetical protein
MSSSVTRLVMLRTRRPSRSWWNCCHSCKIAVLNSSIFWQFGLRWLIFRPIKSHTCSIGFMSGDIAGHGVVWTAVRNVVQFGLYVAQRCRPWTLTCPSTHHCWNGGLRVERAHCHGIFSLSDYHQERTSPTYSQKKNNPRELPHPQKQLCPKCGCPEMKCFVGAKPLPDRR